MQVAETMNPPRPRRRIWRQCAMGTDNNPLSTTHCCHDHTTARGTTVWCRGYVSPYARGERLTFPDGAPG